MQWTPYAFSPREATALCHPTLAVRHRLIAKNSRKNGNRPQNRKQPTKMNDVTAIRVRTEH